MSDTRRKTLWIVSGTIVAIAVVAFIVAGVQASSYNNHFATWQTTSKTYSRSLRAVNFSDKMVPSTETDAQLAVENQSCATAKADLSQLTSKQAAPHVAFNPLGFLQTSYRQARSLAGDRQAKISTTQASLTTQLSQLVAYCTYYTHFVPYGQKIDTGANDAKQYLLFTGTEDSSDHRACSDIGGCVPDTNMAVWPKLAADYQPTIDDATAYVSYIQQHGCYLPTYTKICDLTSQYDTAYVTVYGQYVAALKTQNLDSLNKVSTELTSLYAKYKPLYITAYRAIDPNVDAYGSDYIFRTDKGTVQKIEASIYRSAQALASI